MNRMPELAKNLPIPAGGNMLLVNDPVLPGQKARRRVVFHLRFSRPQLLTSNLRTVANAYSRRRFQA